MPCRAVVASLLAVALAAAAEPAAAAEILPREVLGYFNIPPGAGHPATTIRQTLLAYINGALPGSEIRGHITRISHWDVARALVAAHRRGVVVYLVNNGEANAVGDYLEAYFGTRHKYCGQDYGPAGSSPEDVTSCISTVPCATHHLKNWMFSATVVAGRKRNHSSWVTSYNLTATSDRQFNDVFIVNNDAELHDALALSFRNFYGQRRTDDFYHVAGRGHHVLRGGEVEVSFAPQQPVPELPVNHPDNDQVGKALSRIDAWEPGCTLKAINLSISSSRPAILRQLLRIRALGCQVQVAFGDIHGSALSKLAGGGVELRRAASVGIHSKAMLYQGRYDGVAGRKWVWGGSNNWTSASLSVRDEVFVGIRHSGLHARYQAYFNEVWPRLVPVN